MKFRELKAEEIDVRIGTISEKGCSLLLYKDARVDQNILDEEVGSEYWQRKHEIIGGNLYCSVGIFVKGLDEWVWKQDVGTESNTEKEKGQASDSFKRACVNWGIGRELYTAPFIWVGSNDVKIEQKNGKWTTRERFSVKSISYTDGNISGLEIVNSKGNVVFQQKRTSAKKKDEPKEEKTEEQAKAAIANMKINDDKIKSLQEKCKKDKVPEEKILKLYKLKSLADMREKELKNCIDNWEKVKSS